MSRWFPGTTTSTKTQVTSENDSFFHGYNMMFSCSYTLFMFFCAFVGSGVCLKKFYGLTKMAG